MTADGGSLSSPTPPTRCWAEAASSRRAGSSPRYSLRVARPGAPGRFDFREGPDVREASLVALKLTRSTFLRERPGSVPWRTVGRMDGDREPGVKGRWSARGRESGACSPRAGAASRARRACRGGKALAIALSLWGERGRGGLAARTVHGIDRSRARLYTHHLEPLRLAKTSSLCPGLAICRKARDEERHEFR